MNNDVKQFIEKNILALEDEGIVLFLYLAAIQLRRRDVNILCAYLDTAKVEYKEHVPAVIEELVKDDAELQRKQKVSLTFVVDQLPNFHYTNYLEFRNVVVNAIKKVYPNKVVLPNNYGIEYVMERI